MSLRVLPDLTQASFAVLHDLVRPARPWRVGEAPSVAQTVTRMLTEPSVLVRGTLRKCWDLELKLVLSGFRASGHVNLWPAESNEQTGDQAPWNSALKKKLSRARELIPRPEGRVGGRRVRVQSRPAAGAFGWGLRGRARAWGLQWEQGPPRPPGASPALVHSAVKRMRCHF